MVWLDLVSFIPFLNTTSFVADLLTLPQVQCRDSESLIRKLEAIKRDGTNELLILSDFDYTFSKSHDTEGKPLFSTLDVFGSYLNPEISTKLKNLWTSCIRIEMHPKMSYEEKLPFMDECWIQTHKLIVSAGLTKDQIKQYTLMAKIKLRDDSKDLIKFLAKEEIPMILFSAGIADIIQIVLQKQLGKIPSNLRIISNMLEYDPIGKTSGFKKPRIHCFNKNLTMIPNDGSLYPSEWLNRKNVLLMGDSLGDLYMGMKENSRGTTLKIGFLNKYNDTLIGHYLEGYDLVLVEDQSMEIPRKISQTYLSRSKAFLL